MTHRHLQVLAKAYAWASTCLVLGLVTTAATAADLPSGIPFKTSTPSDDSLVYRAVAAFLFACLAAYGIAWCIKRYLPAFGKSMGKSKHLERLEVMRLSQRSMLIRVRWGNEELLIGENEHGVSLLGKRPLSPSEDATVTSQQKEGDDASEHNLAQKETHDQA